MLKEEEKELRALGCCSRGGEVDLCSRGDWAVSEPELGDGGSNMDSRGSGEKKLLRIPASDLPIPLNLARGPIGVKGPSSSTFVRTMNVPGARMDGSGSSSFKEDTGPENLKEDGGGAYRSEDGAGFLDDEEGEGVCSGIGHSSSNSSVIHEGREVAIESR